MKKRYKIPLFLLAFLFLAVLIFWVLLNQTKLLENQVTRLVNVWLENRYSLRVEVGDVSGPFWKELTITDLTVDYVKEDQTYRIAEFPFIKSSYRLSNLWRKKWILDSLTIDNPSLSIKKTEEGKLLFASPKGGERTVVSKTGLFDFKIGKLRITDGGFEVISPDKKLTVDSLSLELALSKNGEGTQVVIFEGNLLFAEKEFQLRSLKGSLRQKGDSLFIEELGIETGRSTLLIDGSVDNLKEGAFSLAVEANPIDCQDIKNLTGIKLDGILDLKGTAQGSLKRFGGEATLNGLFFDRRFEPVEVKYSYGDEKFVFSSISGRAFDSHISGRGAFDFSVVPEEYEFEGELKNLSIDNIVYGSLRTDLSGHIHMMGRSTAEEELFMQIELNLQPGRVEQYTFSQAKGIMDVTTTAMRFHPLFQLHYKNTGIVLTGKLEYSGELDIDAWVKFEDLADFDDQIFIKEMRGRGKAFVKLSGKTEDFDVKGEFDSDSCWAYELFSSNAHVRADVKNFLTTQRGETEIRFFDGDAWGVAYDSLISRIEMENQLYKIDSAYMGSEHMNVNLWGELDVTAMPQTLMIYQIVLNYQGNQLESLSPTVVNIDTNQVEIIKCVLLGETGRVQASGSIDYEDRMDLVVEISEFDIAPWAGLLTSEPIEGMFTGKVLLTGDFLNPRMDAKAQINKVRFREMRLGQLKTDLWYADRKLQVKDLSITEQGWDYSLSGFLPLDLSLVSVKQRLPDEPQSFRLSAEGKELELIRLFIPDVEYLTGDFEGELEISGNLLRPQFEGRMTLRNGELKFKLLADPIQQLTAEMRMKNEDLILDQISGIMKHGSRERAGTLTKMWRSLSKKKTKTGVVNGFGTISLKDVRNAEYDLYFNGENVPIDYEYADLTATADATVQITGQSPPLVTAQVSLSELFYREPFSSSKSGSFAYSPQMVEELWDWNFDVSVTNNCWIINDDVNLEFAGDILVLREAGQLIPLGNMETIRGTYFLYGTKFRIEEGYFYFDNLEKIDPSIDFLVSTRLWGRSSGSSGSTNLLSTSSSNEIELTITGTLSEPEVQPASGSPYSSEDVIELLAFQRGLGAVDSGGVGSLFQERVVKSLGGAYSSRLLENIAGQTLGVETFEIVPDWSENFRLTDAQITVGKYLSDKLYLSYTRRLSQSSGQEAGAEYRLNKHLFLEGRKDKLGLFHLGLNLNWEY